MTKNRLTLRASMQSVYSAIFSFIIVAAFVSSCNSNNPPSGNTGTGSGNNSDTTPAVARGAGAFFTGEQPPLLYITNKAPDDMLQNLLSVRPGRSKDKWLFQFFRDTGGRLRIQVIPAASGSRDYVLEDAVIPEASDSLMPTPFPAGNVFLGDLQFADRPNSRPVDPPHDAKDTTKALSVLKNHVYPNNSKDWEYIWFVPHLDTITLPGTGGSTFTRTYLVYHLMAAKDKPAKGLPVQPAMIITSQLDYANPSPPRQSY